VKGSSSLGSETSSLDGSPASTAGGHWSRERSREGFRFEPVPMSCHARPFVLSHAWPNVEASVPERLQIV